MTISRQLRVEPSPLGRTYVWTNTPPGFALFYTTREFDGYLTENSIGKIRGFMHQRFGIDATLWTCNQVHGVEVQRVERRIAQTFIECDCCDALWSDHPAVALGIKVADCLPVSLIDPDHGVMAGIHSGWRGTAAKITARTLDRLGSETEFESGSAQAWLGPSIRQCCFEVGDEVVDQFKGVESYVERTRGPRPYLDLIGITIELLVRAGLPPSAIHDSGLCTRCGEDFHSYRRDGRGTGRNLAIVAR